MSVVQETTSLLLRLITIRYKRRRERFEKVLAPMYASFREIHDHYSKVLSQYEATLPYRRQETRAGIVWTMSAGGEPQTHTSGAERVLLRKLISSAKQVGQTAAPDRRLFRERTKDLFEVVKEEPERLFLRTLAAYHGSASHGDLNWWNPDATSSAVRSLTSLGRRKATAKQFVELTEQTSIGESIADLLIETTEYEYPKQMIVGVRRWLNDAYVEVGQSYGRLQDAIIMETQD